ncbi:unnamed protein product [Auanema sp. JU1783]|nr:unnamed protein product [Auanema sp. JU1783]
MITLQLNQSYTCDAQHAPSISPILMKAAKDCLNEGMFHFYDGCLRRCITDTVILPLSHYQDLEELVYGKIFPVIVMFAIVSNMTVAVVLSKKHMITSTNLVLKYMAVAELLVGLIPLPWTLFFFTMKHYEHNEDLELWWCYLNKYSMDALPPIFHNIAMWLTVLLAAQRYVSISYPMYSRSICNLRNVRIATLVITAVSFGCGLPKSFDYYLDVVDSWVLSGFFPDFRYTRACTSKATPFLLFVGPTLFYNIYFWTRTIFFITLPSILLVILNILLIRQLRLAELRKIRLLKEKRSEEAARQRDINSTSYMLVFIVSLFLIVNLPQAAFMGVLCVCETFHIRVALLDGIFPAVFLLSSNMLVMATYPINFGIYCFMSSSFRQTFEDIFVPTWFIHFRNAMQTERTATRSVMEERNEATEHLMLSDVPSARYYAKRASVY